MKIFKKPSLDELYHHGVKGQKWGVRNDKISDAVKKVSQAMSNVAKETLRIGKKITSQLGSSMGKSVKSLGRETIAQGKSIVKSMASEMKKSIKQAPINAAVSVMNKIDKRYIHEVISSGGQSKMRRVANPDYVKRTTSRTFKSNKTIWKEGAGKRQREWEERRYRYADNVGGKK